HAFNHTSRPEGAGLNLHCGLRQHVAHGEIAECHDGCQVEPSLVPGAKFAACCNDTGGIQPCNRRAPLMHDLPVLIGEQASGCRAERWVQCEPVEWRLRERAEAAVCRWRLVTMCQ